MSAETDLNWNNLRALGGSQQNGFEELCCQLADSERPAGSSFERKGRPDAGVECFAVLPDGREWAWQAKFFDRLDEVQWRQLDESVRAAVAKHPRLARYFVCVPLDLADARVPRQKSARDRWNERVAKWSGWARDRGVEVEFVYWGSYELIDRLSRPEHAGRVRFWFDVHRFHETWFAARLEEALGAAGPRYTPEIHVSVPIAEKLEAFGRTPRFVSALKLHGRRIRDGLQRCEYGAQNEVALEQNGLEEEPAETGPSPVRDIVAEVSAAVGHVLSGLASLEPQPVGVLPLDRLAKDAGAAVAAVDTARQSLSELDEPPRASDAPGQLPPERNRHSSYTRVQSALYELEIELDNIREALEEADVLANSGTLVLTGQAGTGKTHLLCDVARRRLAEGRPTVLLMGQRFMNRATPWTQAAEMLDLAGISAEEFVGALEAAAQAAGSRALVIIDALNEGTGRTLWPAHLAAFLTQLLRSEWIRVVLAVRESYEARVIPDTVSAGAARIEHSGFDGREYDATKTFFAHYGIERPSAPLLPEFRNPLFLKVLCRGLRDRGERRVPRGFHGITAVFDLFLGALNLRLARELGFNERHLLAKKACMALASAFVEEGRPWLRLERAEELVNALSPGRDFERSLYHALVAEGVLVEEGRGPGGTDEQVVIIAYERLADHLIASELIDRHVDPENPGAAFQENGPLGWLAASDQPAHGYVTTGLLEAFCVQLPERTGKELAECCPRAARTWGFANAFRQSLVWRAPDAFSGATLDLFGRVAASARDERAAVEVLLTLALIPGHPWNAAFLHERLRREPMPSRDSRWSVALHRLWDTRSAARSLVDWAWSQSPSSELEDEVVELGAIALAWMLTTPNRFARDRATKALVTLLTGRISAVVRLLELFVDVDDPYVSERLFAVAYGCAMRSSEAAEVGALARTVYAQVFAGGEPPRHILLRDYARGVLERAEYLGAGVPVTDGPYRPPYRSQWPTIPTEEDIAALKPDWSQISHDCGDPGWGMGRIWSSVMDDDFARYVIGTNNHSINWLQLRLEEPEWQILDERLDALVATFDKDELAAWREVERAAGALEEAMRAVRLDEARAVETDGTEGEVGSGDTAQRVKNLLEQLGGPRQELEQAIGRLNTAVTGDKAVRLDELLAEKRNATFRDAPRLDLRLIQRYVLARVFELGWTTERFGRFDKHDIGYHGRDATKAERMGKKYQWIAFHEILASISDHYQYRERFREDDGDRAYEGPWQDSLRDIDPSCILRGPSAEKEEDTGATSWWTSAPRTERLAAADRDEWAMSSDDLPEIPEFLVITRAGDGAAWLNLDGSFAWRQAAPPDQDPNRVDRRDLFFIWHGYFVRSGDSAAFLEWAETVDFWDRMLPDPPSRYQMFLGEHAWSPAARYFDQPYHGSTGWVPPRGGCPVGVRGAAADYVHERAGFDCSADESFTLRLPADELVRSARLRWSGFDAEFLDSNGDLFSFDPAASEPGPNALVVARKALRRYLADNGLELCWAVKGMKQIIPAGFGMERRARLICSGAYGLAGETLSGLLTCRPSRRDGATTETVAIRRTLSIA